MKYRLVYRRRATRSLARIWLAADDRAAVTRAGDRLERYLTNDPLGVGESRSGDDRVIVVDPLVAFYTVDAPNRKVVVNDIRSP